MSVQYIGASSYSPAPSTSSFTVATTDGGASAVGDLRVVVICWYSFNANSTMAPPPTGWSGQIRDDHGTNRIAVYQKVVTADEAAATFTWNGVTTGTPITPEEFNATVFTVRGAHPNAPVGIRVGSSTSATAGVSMPRTNGSALFAYFSARYSSGATTATGTDPTGMTRAIFRNPSTSSGRTGHLVYALNSHTTATSVSSSVTGTGNTSSTGVGLVITPAEMSSIRWVGETAFSDAGQAASTTITATFNVNSVLYGRPAVGNWLLMRLVSDNAGTDGAAPSVSISDPRSNTWTLVGQALNDPGAANEGTWVGLYLCRVTTAYARADVITITTTNSRKYLTIEEWWGLDPTTPVGATSPTTGTGTSWTGSVSAGIGSLVMCALAVEHGDATIALSSTADGDGPWYGIKSGPSGTGTTGQRSYGQVKVVGTAGTKTCAGTTTSADWAQLMAALNPVAPVAFTGATSTVTATAGAGSFKVFPTSTATAHWTTAAFPVAYATGVWDDQHIVTATASGRWSALWLSQIPFAGATSTVTATAGAGSLDVLPGRSLGGATAHVTAIADPGEISLGTTPPVLEGATAEVSAEAGGGQLLVGTGVVGDSFHLPVALSGLGGTGAAQLVAATLEPGEPYTHGATRTWWFGYAAAGPGLLTVTSTNTALHWVDIYEGDSLAALTLLGTAERTSDTPINLTVALSYGRYYIRVASSAAVTINLSYAASVIVPELIVENRTPVVYDTPDTIRVGVLNAEPEEDVRFEWYPPVSTWVPSTVTRPIELITLTADETGAILAATVPLGEVGAGSYTIYARGLASGRDATVTVVVENDPAPITDLATDDDDGSTFTVGYWVMKDLAPGGLGTFTFPINPTSMSSPYAPRLITTEYTTAADGQPILWEGGLVAHDWSFAGYLDSQEFHDKLVAFARLNHRFKLQDHRGRIWIVAISGLDIKPRRNQAKPWAHEYTVQASIYARVNP